MAELLATPIHEIPQIVDHVRATYRQGHSLSYEWRRQQLYNLHQMIKDRQKDFVDALQADLRKPSFEGILTECAVIQAEVVHTYDNLKKWMKPKKPSVPLVHFLDKCEIQYQPYGVVLIIGPWNYPLQLIFAPLIGAIAAGNAAILKPSELAPHTARLITRLVPFYLDSNFIKVVNGGVSETQTLLQQRFDYIFFTGGTNIGKIVMSAASKYLTPLTLELGGKSPVIIDHDVDIPLVAQRICWGKFVNTGQTCIAPDYILCHESVYHQFIDALKAAAVRFYGDNPQLSADYGRIISSCHLSRLQRLLEGSHVEMGGIVDPSDLYMSPTILTNVREDSAVMQEEIFGPILPVLSVNSLDDAIDFVVKREKPLVLYAFSRTKSVIHKIQRETSSGGFLSNDVLMHVGVPELPFGGVGYSGMGSYHGQASFLTFSHHRSVMERQQNLESLNSLRYAPYSEEKLGQISRIMFPRDISKDSSCWSRIRSMFSNERQRSVIPRYATTGQPASSTTLIPSSLPIGESHPSSKNFTDLKELKGN